MAAAGRQHAGLRRDGAAGHVVRRRLAGEGLFRSAGDPPGAGLAGAGRSRQDFRSRQRLCRALLALHKQYAQLDAPGRCWRGTIEELEAKLAEARGAAACLLSLGWGGGLLGKSAWLDTANQEYRQILQQLSLYSNALSSNLPFPKTRRIVFLNNKPASLPGWALLEIE